MATETITLRVDDMSCGHCASAIKKAIEGAVPGARVEADPDTKLVRITGADTTRSRALIEEAGYTPQAV